MHLAVGSGSCSGSFHLGSMFWTLSTCDVNGGMGGSPPAEGGCFPLCRCQHWERGVKSWEKGRRGRTIREPQWRARRSRLGQCGAASGCCSSVGLTDDKECASSSTRISNSIHYQTPGQVAQVPVKLTGHCFVLNWMQPFNGTSMQWAQTTQVFFFALTVYLPSIYLSQLFKV